MFYFYFKAGIFICNVLFIIDKEEKNNHTRKVIMQCCLSENVFQSFASSFLNSDDDELVWIALNFIRARLSFKLKPENLENAGQPSLLLYWSDNCDAIMHSVVEYLQVLHHHVNDNIREKVFEIFSLVS